jgi:SAM-dependent methyltransferase
VDPKIMYGPAYPFRSGISEGWAFHCHELAKEIGKGKRVLEIGCLDGVMLRHCRDNGCEVQGVDPSSPVVDLPIFHEFFGPHLSWQVCFDYIIAQNVFGHVDDVHGFLEGVVRNLAPEGVCVIECPWIVDLVQNAAWDTVYHEHLSYWGVKPLMRLAKDVGLHVNEVKHFPTIHGGTLRYYLSRKPTMKMDVFNYFAQEEEIDTEDWAELRSQFSMAIEAAEDLFRVPGLRIAGYGASAKFNTFLNSLPNRPPLTGIFDETPSKAGLLTPGWGFPVRFPERVELEKVDVLLVGSPNWKVAIEKKARSHGFTGEVRSLWG